MRAVVKLGGALFPSEPDSPTIKRIARILAQFIRKNNSLVLVAGGGANARSYITAARRLGADESTSDLIGIKITRANAELMRIAMEMENISATLCLDLGQLPSLLRLSQVTVMGGLQPGQSTNTVAALAAEISHARILVNATDVDGVYTENPKKNPQARLLKTIDADKLLKMALAGDVLAGKYELLDPLAIKTLLRSRIPSRFVSILPPQNIIHALTGRNVGTLVRYS